MQLLRLGRLGAFDFNSRFYADDDLIVGAADPFQLFRIMVEVVRGGYDEGSGPTSSGTAGPTRFGPSVEARQALPDAQRREKAAALAQLTGDHLDVPAMSNGG